MGVVTFWFFTAMAIKTYDNDAVGDIQLPFYEAYFYEFPEDLGRIYPVERITGVKSGKGFLVSTKMFSCWLWKNSTLAKSLFRDCEAVLASGHCHTLIVHAMTNDKGGYVLGWDDEAPACIVRNGDMGFTFSFPTAEKGRKQKGPQ